MNKIAIAATALLAAGCAKPPQDAPRPIGMPNPASAYCIERGGRLVIEDRPAGQIGICTLPDGTRIEEWELYRRDHPPK
ncbi:putative hemolysin [Bordetella hinzii]|uniref:putative hemolysin n=1 Tax=Bordetella hinzii TaxID=103855 RepID=UPI000427748E|nr:DUF333 domain-containing protein [Bordetella hinzii]AKQ55858.1 hypothetical protein ACR54_02543 [Bordetella hinzii]KCB33523.1 PF03891 domain protein [Bordetella hinzii L60]KCB46037.1 PF03891 domain protein [Bordetella hinzii 4161]KCB52482.1 PF03891 domain protein [Bordetella hinzii 1277]KXA71482.1 transcriptional regulator [Bordetella hinzii LMG 13501]